MFFGFPNDVIREFQVSLKALTHKSLNLGGVQNTYEATFDDYRIQRINVG